MVIIWLDYSLLFFWRNILKHPITSDGSFENDVLNSEKPVLLNYYAAWCGPCRALSPVLDEIYEDLGNDISIVSINVDDNPKIPAKYGIRAIPTLTIFKAGQQIDSESVAK
ncbi:MAG: redoxin domain-containing protein [Proteobacteria bacterium]|nr:redoxin domain-containing protein [Pseudomonadota bacterium]MBU1742030.1 redoxin domain-containing protein [Pseudomonadota bacterium]